jgi:hypothetical protein
MMRPTLSSNQSAARRDRPTQHWVAASAAGYADLLARVRVAAGSGTVQWAMEGTRHYGLGLARYLTAEGQRVTEIENTRHVGRRRAGKSDPIDAVRAARELLARPRPGQMRCDGDREALRLLMVDRDDVVHSCKTARTVLASVIVTAPEELREQLRGLTRARPASSCRGSAGRRSHRVVARGHPPSRMASQCRLAPAVIEAIAVLRLVHRRINRDHPGKGSDGHYQDSLHAQQPRRNRPSAPECCTSGTVRGLIFTETAYQLKPAARRQTRVCGPRTCQIERTMMASHSYSRSMY